MRLRRSSLKEPNAKVVSGWAREAAVKVALAAGVETDPA
jgi:hypothetical protein